MLTYQFCCLKSFEQARICQATSKGTQPRLELRMAATTEQEAVEADEDDDYMSMAILEPQKAEKETSIQRRARKQREARTLLFAYNVA